MLEKAFWRLCERYINVFRFCRSRIATSGNAGCSCEPAVTDWTRDELIELLPLKFVLIYSFMMFSSCASVWHWNRSRILHIRRPFVDML